MRIYAILPALLVIGLSAAIAGAQQNASESLTVYAATSLTDVFEALADAFAEDHPDVEILLNFANSATLAAQIAAGAPADVYASANELQMANAVTSGRVDESEVEIFAHNQLIVIVPADNPAMIEAVGDLAGDGILLVLAAEGTPIRAYTDAMLASHNGDYGGDFSESVLRNLVSEESNVRQVVARVALGEADAGIVYQSDALGAVADQLIALSIDERHNQLASYPIAPLNDGAAKDLAEQFIQFVRSPTAQAILAGNGFCPLPIQSDELATDTAPATESADVDDAPVIECEAATIENG